MDVNWAALDEMVIDFCKADDLILEQDGSSQGNAGTKTVERVRWLIECGCIPEAVSLISQHAHGLLEDQRILFWLYKQHFIEMLRSGGSASRSEAIECSRVKLGPCALNAYPEAYEEFKRLLLALIYDREHQNSPVADEWSEAKRAELAATIASTLRARLQVHDPLFSLTLRYLISIHNAYDIRRSFASPVGDFASDLVFRDRDPPPALQTSFAEVPSFSEVDVQALAQAAELPRQAAVESLKYTSGDVMTALKNELSRIRMNTTVLDKLVREYGVCRGFIDGGSTVVERAEAAETMSDCCTSGAQPDAKAQPELKRYRWRGRSSPFTSLSDKTQTDKLESAAFGKYRRAVQVAEMISDKRIREAIEAVKGMDPGFFSKHPELLFQMKQVEFSSFIQAGNHSRALEIARLDLGPLAAKHAELLTSMKKTLMCLACPPAEATTLPHISAAALAGSVQVALCASLDISEPLLMKIMRACLCAHTEWFKLQMCSDPFAELLKINTLKLNEAEASKVAAPEPPGEVPPFEEKSILTVMEWMALPRGDAIQLLADCGGSVDDAIGHFMG